MARGRDTEGAAAVRVATVLCFSHLRWDFVWQRPQHLMQRFAEDAVVLYWEEPVYEWGMDAPRLRVRRCRKSGVEVFTPVLREEDDRAGDRATLTTLLDAAIAGRAQPMVRWYYTPMMYPFSAHLPASCIVYDCMDEPTHFKNAPAALVGRESLLLAAADLVFTGGHALFDAKRERHHAVHAFPSSVDLAHFAAARAPGADPVDQVALPRPRLGFYGVIDDRLDLDLVAALAAARPQWMVVMIGPVMKRDPEALPSRTNLQFLGHRGYDDLPAYLRGWDVALMPFALNAATRFISPTKTPEYLAAGCPVVTTPIADVVRQYGNCPAVHVAADSAAFVAACDAAMAQAAAPATWLTGIDRMLAGTSWDATFAAMAGLIAQVLARQPAVAADEGFEALLLAHS